MIRQPGNFNSTVGRHPSSVQTGVGIEPECRLCGTRGRLVWLPGGTHGGRHVCGLCVDGMLRKERYLT